MAAKQGKKVAPSATTKKANVPPIKQPRIDWRETFLAALRERPNVTKAARAAGVDRSTAYRQREVAPEFAVEWERALKIGVGALIDVAFERAFTGSDTLLIFLAKAHDPMYREKSELTLKRPDLSKMTDAELAALAEGKPL